MVLQCSKLFYHNVSSEYLRQDSQSSYSFSNTVYYSFMQTQNVGETELSEEKVILYIYIYIYYISQGQSRPLFYWSTLCFKSFKQSFFTLNTKVFTFPWALLNGPYQTIMYVAFRSCWWIAKYMKFFAL